MSWKEGGLNKNKYIVRKADRSPVSRQAQYFVLRLDTDPNARIAARVYARAVSDVNPQFAQELTDWIWKLEEEVA